MKVLRGFFCSDRLGVVKRSLVVTGGIASGKSTVGRMFGDLGFSVVDADLVGREVFSLEVVSDWLREEFGECEDMRSAVRGRMGDIDFRKRLDGVMHPLIFDRLIESRADIIEIPLLVEAGLMSAFGVVVACYCPIEVARERLISRLGDANLAEKLLRSQVCPVVRNVFADEIIRTDLELESVRDMVQTVVDCHL
jgi:dephospho-CoA kinase